MAYFINYNIVNKRKSDSVHISSIIVQDIMTEKSYKIQVLEEINVSEFPKLVIQTKPIFVSDEK